jgi:hypothetical protein
MLDALLLPERTVITANGDSGPVDISSATSRTLLLTLTIQSVVEQESIEVSVFTSEDGTAWEAKPVAGLPQKFYAGEYPLLLDLSQSPNARWARAHWDVNRWGRGTNKVHFEIGLRLREVPREMLDEARERALSGPR